MTTACFEGHSKSIKVKMKVAFIKFDGFFYIVVTWKATANPKFFPNEAAFVRFEGAFLCLHNIVMCTYSDAHAACHVDTTLTCI